MPAIALADLRAEPFILFPRTVAAGLRNDILAACRAAGFDPHIVQEAPQFTWIRFTGGDDAMAEFSVGGGKSETEEPAPWRPTKAPWKGLQAHGSFAKERVKITFERITTSLGTFDCALYAVTGEREGKPEVTRHWFAFDKPGPPIRTTVTTADADTSHFNSLPAQIVPLHSHVHAERNSPLERGPGPPAAAPSMARAASRPRDYHRP